jgi:hypothetical protein
MARTAVRSSRPKSSRVVSDLARGRTLMVTSVITASVPQDPAISFERS